MRIVFMGTPEIAATCLEGLVEGGFDVVGVFTKPDTPKNRGMKLLASPVKEYALSQGIAVYQPATLKDGAALEQLRKWDPDVIAVVAYGKLLPRAILELPEKGCVNIHASALPLLRGSGPVQWAILNGFSETGVTAMYMAEEMDAGDVIEIRKTPITPEDNGQTLMDRLAVLGAGLLADTMAAMERGGVPRRAQDGSKATFAPMLSKEMSPIDWTKSAWEISCQVRGLYPWPVATAEVQGTVLKVYEVDLPDTATEQAPGTLLGVTRAGLEVAAGDGRVVVLRQVQSPGGKRMAAADYFRGHPLKG